MAKSKVVYKIIQDVTDAEDPSGAYVVIDVTNNKILAEFDFKLEAQNYIKELKNQSNGKISHSLQTV
jgi:hypothetical protein